MRGAAFVFEREDDVEGCKLALRAVMKLLALQCRLTDKGLAALPSDWAKTVQSILAEKSVDRAAE